MLKIREVELSDAGNLACLIQQVEANSEYMLWEPGERAITENRQKAMIESLQQSGNSTILVAEEEDFGLVGYLFAIGERANRNRHNAYLVIGILDGYRGQGIGSKLFQYIHEWALQKHLHRLELTVVTENEAGLSLYKKAGFEIEGIKKDSLLIHGSYVNEYYMAKLL